MSQPSESYKKVITGGLRFKGDAGLVKRRSGMDKNKSLSAAGSLKPKLAAKPEPGLADPAVAAAAAASSSASSAASSATSMPPPAVVLDAPTNRSGWALHKNELHEIDSNLTQLREQARAVERLDADAKRRLIEAEKKAAKEAAAAVVTQQNLPRGFSVPDSSRLNRDSLYRSDVPVGDASARLEARAKKKADRYCK